MKRAKVSGCDWVLCVLMRRLLDRWGDNLLIVKPDTVIKCVPAENVVRSPSPASERKRKTLSGPVPIPLGNEPGATDEVFGRHSRRFMFSRSDNS